MKIPYAENMWNLLLERHPIIKLAQPRRIAYPHGYYNPQCISLEIGATAIECRQDFQDKYKGIPLSDTALFQRVVLCNDLLKYGVPTYFVDPEFAMACDATILPSELKFQDIKMPMPAFALVLHERFVKARIRRTVPHIVVASFMKGVVDCEDSFNYMANRRISFEVAPSKEPGHEGTFAVMFTVYGNKDSVNYTSRNYIESPLTAYQQDDRPFTDDTLALVEFFKDRNPKLAQEMQEELGQFPTGKEEQDFIKDICVLATKITLAMSAIPNCISSSGGMARKQVVKRGIVTKEALWHPIMVGAGYKLKTDRGIPGDGTHASPRMHWRKGHWHHVVHGKGRSLRKLSWFEPVLVNPPE